MMKLSVCIFLFYILFLAIIAANYQNVVRIAPRKNSTILLPTFKECIERSTLSSAFNRSNMVIEFLPGEHTIAEITTKKYLLVKDISNVTWRGVSNGISVILCRQEFGLVFVEVANITLQNLIIQNCGNHYTSFNRLLPFAFVQSRESVMAALGLLRITSLTMLHVQIKQSRGYGFLAINMIGHSLISFCTFSDNSNKNINSQASGHSMPILRPGGNIAIMYDDTKWTESSTLAIRDSAILNGSDASNECQCNGFSRSNGLLILLLQTKFTVQILIEDVLFEENFSGYNYSSIFIHNLRGLNSIKFINCIFKHDGSLIIQQQSSTLSNIYTHFASLIIERSTFYKGNESAIGIIIYGKMKVLISSCKFVNFQSDSRNAVIIEIEHKSIFLTQVQVDNTSFINNNMSCIKITFRIPFEVHLPSKPTSPVGSVNGCIFRGNHVHSNNYLVHVSYSPQTISRKYNKNIGKYSNQAVFNNTIFINNIVTKSKGLLVAQAVILGFLDCSFLNSVGTTIMANDSFVNLYGENRFINNTGTEGGAISLIRSSLHLTKNSKTVIKDNKANYGGGLFAIPTTFDSMDRQFCLDTWYCTITLNEFNLSLPLCSLGLPSYGTFANHYPNSNISIELIGNSANVAGDSIFYGSFSQCFMSVFNCLGIVCKQNYMFVNNSLFESIALSTDDTSLFSMPNKLHTCKQTFTSNSTIRTFPGAVFNISIRTVGEYPNTQVPSVVVVGRLCNYHLNPQICEYDYENELRFGIKKQIVAQSCSNITYSIHGSQGIASLEIRVTEFPGLKSSIDLRVQDIYTIIKVQLLSCPIGYRMASKSNEKPFCECVEYLSSFNIECDINQEGKILRPRRIWIGFHYLNPRLIAANKNCPYDYCLPYD